MKILIAWKIKPAFVVFVRSGNCGPPFSPLATNQTAHIEKPENQSLWGILLPGRAVAE
jgi:hypothetical protein